MPDRLNDDRFMASAIRLAQRHIGQTGENPSVGALIVQDKAGSLEIVGHGVTARGGRPHAEVQALSMAGNLAKNATAYVTLEPCSHFGKTPPCVDALIDAGISRVVVALTDPDERVSGKGIAKLRSAGINVDVGCLWQQAYETLSAYLCGKINKRAELTLKMAISSDGGIGLAGKGNVQITGAISQSRSHMMRYEHQSIMVGVGTVLSDNPELTCRLSGLGYASPIRVVIDPMLRIPLSSKLVLTANITPLWIIYQNESEQEKANELQKLGCTLIKVEEKDGIFQPQHILEVLYSRNITSVLLEGGAFTAKAFIKNNCVDRFMLFNSPVVLGNGMIKAPNFDDFLLKCQKIQTAIYGLDHFSEWRNKQSCLLEL